MAHGSYVILYPDSLGCGKIPRSHNVRTHKLSTHAHTVREFLKAGNVTAFKPQTVHIDDPNAVKKIIIHSIPNVPCELKAYCRRRQVIDYSRLLITDMIV